jgi:hypothetical protein
VLTTAKSTGNHSVEKAETSEIRDFTLFTVCPFALETVEEHVPKTPGLTMGSRGAFDYKSSGRQIRSDALGQHSRLPNLPYISWRCGLLC